MILTRTTVALLSAVVVGVPSYSDFYRNRAHQLKGMGGGVEAESCMASKTPECEARYAKHIATVTGAAEMPTMPVSLAPACVQCCAVEVEQQREPLNPDARDCYRACMSGAVSEFVHPSGFRCVCRVK